MGGALSGTTSPQSGSKSPCSGPRFVLELARIRRLVVQVKTIEEEYLPPPLRAGGSNSTPPGLADYSQVVMLGLKLTSDSQVDMLGPRYKCGNLRAETSPCPHIGEPKQNETELGGRSGRLKFTVRRHNFNKYSLSSQDVCTPKEARVERERWHDLIAASISEKYDF